MSELNDKQLAIIDSYAVHILAGLINSPHFDPSEFKSTADMMQQQCELAYVYAEKLLISRNRFKQMKQPERKRGAEVFNVFSAEEIINQFIQEKVLESSSTMPVRTNKNKNKEKGIYEYFSDFLEEKGIKKDKIKPITFSMKFYDLLDKNGVNYEKKRDKFGIRVSIAIKE